MANEIDKTIEELEAEVIAELEEANGADAPKKSAVPAEKSKKVDKVDGDEIQDTGKAVVDPDQKDAPSKKVIAKAKTSKNATSAGSPEKMQKVKEEADSEDDEMEEPSTKAELMKAMADMQKGATTKELQAMFNGMKKEAENGDDDEEDMDEVKKEAIEKRVKEVNVKEHVDALINGEGDLSEEFKKKAATVFEAAVKSKIRDEVVRLEDEYSNELKENIEKTKGELAEKVDTYLNYVVEEWMKENELAIDRGLKGEIAEDFISGLKTLFEDHYVDIPDEKYDVLEAQSEKITELEGKLNEAIETTVSLKKNNGTLVREQVIREATQDLADTEIEKFKSLTEDVDFTDEESFREKLGTLKENYFPKQKKEETTETIDDVETGLAQDIDTTDSMKAYMSAIGKFGNSAK